MKRLIKTATLLSLFFSVWALGDVFRGEVKEWCEGTKWMAKENGKTIMIDNCARTGERCVEYENGDAGCESKEEK